MYQAHVVNEWRRVGAGSLSSENTEERMTPVHRSLAGDVIALDLSEEMQIVRDELAEGHARSAKPSGEADRD